MNNQIYKQNIFIQQSGKKYNPDVETNKNFIENTRKQVVFKQSKTVYNAITNNVPEIINTQKDLELKKDTPINNIDNIINEKAKERLEQDILYKPIKHKMINETNIGDDKNTQLINNFIELKNDEKAFLNVLNKQIEQNKNKSQNILKNLKRSKII